LEWFQEALWILCLKSRLRRLRTAVKDYNVATKLFHYWNIYQSFFSTKLSILTKFNSSTFYSCGSLRCHLRQVSNWLNSITSVSFPNGHLRVYGIKNWLQGSLATRERKKNIKKCWFMASKMTLSSPSPSLRIVIKHICSQVELMKSWMKILCAIRSSEWSAQSINIFSQFGFNRVIINPAFKLMFQQTRELYSLYYKHTTNVNSRVVIE